MVRDFLAHHDRRSVQVAIGDPREDRAVGDAQPLYPDHTALRINHRLRVVGAAHAAGTTGVIGAFGMFADEGVKLFVALHIGPRLDLVFDEGFEGVLRKDLPGEANTGTEFLPILVLRHVVEKDLRRVGRIARGQRDRPARGRPHRPHMRLKPVAFGGGLPVIAHSNRQEVILDIGIFNPRLRPDEGRAFELVRRAHAGFREQPLRANHGLGKDVPVLVQRDWLAGGHLDIQFKVVLQVLAHTGAVGDHLDTMLCQMGRRADARQHQQLGRVDGGRRDDHLAAGAQHLGLATAQHLDPDSATVFDHDPLRQGADEFDVAGRLRGPQIGVGRGPATALPDRLLHRAEAFLFLAVIIVGRLIARLFARLDKGFEQGVFARATADMQRAIGAAPVGVAPVAAVMPAFHAFEIGQHIGIAPAVGPLLFPVVIVHRVPAHIDHPVDRRRSADHLATRGRQTTVIQMRFGFGLEPPVVGFHVHRIGQGRRHLDERARIAATMFDHHHLAPCRGQAVRHRAARTARPYDNKFSFHPIAFLP